MFGKKTGTEEKGKPQSPLAILIEKIDRLAPGQQLMYRLAEMYGPEIIIVEAKKDYAGKGPKFAVIGSPPVNGKPGPSRNTIWETGKAKAIAVWLQGRDAQPYA
jgi:hypothetical protein